MRSGRCDTHRRSRTKPRKNQYAPSAVYRIVLSEWHEIVGPRVARQLAGLARKYERMVRRIDRDYAIGRLRGIEKREEEAEELRDVLEGLYAEYHDAGERMASEMEVSAEENLAYTWFNRDSFASRSDWIGNMRDIIETTAFQSGGLRFRPTDKQLLEMARDAAERRSALVARYKRKLTRRSG